MSDHALDEPLRRARLLARHEAYGRSADDAAAWVAAVDDPNAALVEAVRDRADLVLDLTAWSPASAPYFGGIRIPPSTRTTSPFM